MPTVLNERQREQLSGLVSWAIRGVVITSFVVGASKFFNLDLKDMFKSLSASPKKNPPTEQKKENAVPADSIQQKQQNQPQKKTRNKLNQNQLERKPAKKKYAFLGDVQQPDKINELYDVTPVGGTSQSKAK